MDRLDEFQPTACEPYKGILCATQLDASFDNNNQYDQITVQDM